MISGKKNEIISKQIDDMLVAGIRIFGQAIDIPAVFDSLESIVGEKAVGKPIILFYWGHPGPEQDIELCLPVGQLVQSGEVKSRILKGGKFLTIRHTGPYENLPDRWGKIYGFMKEKRIGWGNGPGREIYLEGPEVHGDQKEHYLTEIQVPMLLPEWIGNLEEGVERLAGKEAAEYVVSNGRDLNIKASARQKAFWVQGMVKRLEDTVIDIKDRHEILAACSHVFPERRVAHMRKLFEQSGSLDAVLACMNEDRSERGANYYESPQREEDIIRVTKIPFDAQEYKRAQTSLEKKLAYCHCPMVKVALEEGENLSPTYCHCGAGWYHTLWEGILGKPVQVNVIRSLLNGDEACEFAIHLPA